MIKDLDMNICTDCGKLQNCDSCHKKYSVVNNLVARQGIIVLCDECMKELCFHGLNRLHYDTDILIKERKLNIIEKMIDKINIKEAIKYQNLKNSNTKQRENILFYMLNIEELRKNIRNVKGNLTKEKVVKIIEDTFRRK